MKNQQYFVYILLCTKNRLYTGYTTDLVRRYQQHITGKANCKFTRSFKPLEIAQSWQIYANKSIALQIESFIKQLNKQQKLNLIHNPDQLQPWFATRLCTSVKIIPLTTACLDSSNPVSF